MDQRARNEKLIDLALGDLLSIPEVWIIRPLLYSWPDATDPGSIGRRVVREVESYGFLLGRSKSVYAVHPHGFLLGWGTENQRRSLGRFAREAVIVPPTYRDRFRVFVNALKRRNQELVDEVDRALSTLRVVPKVQIARLVRQAAREMIWTRRLLEDQEICRVLVATQHNVQARAMAVVAREAAVPSVYVPHAPVANNREYADLPVDYAALRGREEIEHYANLGADRNRLVTVGNMALDRRVDQLIEQSGPAVVAPSPWSKERVEKFLNMVDEGVVQNFLVCPHPRSNVANIKEVLPERGKIVDAGTTWEQLIDGASVVIQSSSGVALEALLMGLPVIEVRWDGSIPSYPIIREPYVYFANDGQDIARILGLLESGEADEQRHGRRVWARQWCAAVGHEAEERLASLLQANLRSTGFLIDEWGREQQDPPRGGLS